MTMANLGAALCDLIDDQADWSRKTFGPDDVRGPIGPLKHLRKECTEAIQKPYDVKEYGDILILLLDSSRRAGFQISQVIGAAMKKMAENRERTWPPFDLSKVDEAVEHVRTDAEKAAKEAEAAVPSMDVIDHGIAALTRIRDTLNCPAGAPLDDIADRVALLVTSTQQTIEMTNLLARAVGVGGKVSSDWIAEAARVLGAKG